MPQGVRFTGAYEAPALPALIREAGILGFMQKVPSAFRHFDRADRHGRFEISGPATFNVTSELQHARRIFRD
jgi:hypothetical protein